MKTADYQKFIKLANFVSRTSYRKKSFRNGKDIKRFFKYTSNYEHLTNSNKYELNQEHQWIFLDIL